MSEFVMPACSKHDYAPRKFPERRRGYKWWCRRCRIEVEVRFRDICEDYWREERYLNRIDEKYEYNLIVGGENVRKVGKVRITDAAFKELLSGGDDFTFGAALHEREITGLIVYPIPDEILPKSNDKPNVIDNRYKGYRYD